MNDDQLDARLDALLRDAQRTYNAPPDVSDTESLWSAIDAALPTMPNATRPRLEVVRDDVLNVRRPRPWHANPWLRMAAVLFLGVAIGRGSTRVGGRRAAAPVTVAESAPNDSPANPERAATTEYLGRAEALLAALPSELRERRLDPAYQTQADALLLQTRLLQDSPAATDPALRALFDDLEVVLAQVVRLRGGPDRTRVDFLRQAMEQRDVLPRLRDAVHENAAD